MPGVYPGEPALVTEVGAQSSPARPPIGIACSRYKLNWPSLFVGGGDERELSVDERLESSDRQFFVKVSYAFQG